MNDYYNCSPDDFFPPECPDCEKKDKIIDECAYWTEALLENITNKNRNFDDLCWYIEELAAILNVKLPNHV